MKRSLSFQPAAEPAAVPGDSPAGADDPLKELTEEELKLVAIWAKSGHVAWE